MSSISKEQRKNIELAIIKIAKKHIISGVCLYGSKVAGYARPNSDFDVIIVLEDYAYVLKYVYLKESEIELSALVVDRKSLERDANSAFLGEFVIGRLLHIYESLINPELFRKLEAVYKKRVILEEISEMVRSTNILCTELTFPLEYIMFSKIRRRSILYPNALYSYSKIYTGQNSQHNIEFALNGYRQALKDILEEDDNLLILRSNGNLVQISERRVDVQRSMKVASLKLTKRMQEFASYFIHAYAGRHTLQYIIKEAEAKINRHKKYPVELPKFISNPKEYYWKLPEGFLIIDDKNWLDAYAESKGLFEYTISSKHKLGSTRSSTGSFTLIDLNDGSRQKTIVVKEFAKSKAVRWTDLKIWPAYDQSIGKCRIDPLFRLGNEYKALRYIRFLGLNTPIIESVVLGKKMLITEFIEGKLISDIIKNCLKNNTTEGLDWIKVAGEGFAIIHADRSTLGNIKPRDFIISKDTLYITGIEQFGFKSGDPVLDIIHFVSEGLKRTRNTVIAKQITKQFLYGYSKETTVDYIKKLTNAKYYDELFYPLLTPAVAQTIKKELSTFTQ
jgi:tRNA A-37 threonylcarbamoyl transferase component Bud32/predicted nucleotidyltransferase